MSEPAEPERYLRMLAERTLLEGEETGRSASSVDRAGCALVAAAVLSEEVADSVVADHELACLLRGLSRRGRRRAVARRASGVPAPLTPARVFALPLDVEVPWGELTLRWVRLGDDETDISVTGRMAGGRTRMRRGPPQGPGALQVADDRGTQATCHFSGSWGDQLEGTFTTRTPLARDTAWLDVAGHRVELSSPSGPPVEVRVEQLPARPPGIAYLWHQLAVVDAHRGLGAEAPVELDALVAVGAVDPEDPEVKALTDVRAALGGGGRGATVAPVPGAPEPWATLLSQGSLAGTAHADGVTGVVPVGVVVGPVDGALVAIDAIEARPQGLALEVQVSPGTGLERLFVAASRHALEWWVEDDLGVVRIGHAGSSGGSDKKMRATIELERGIDPEARILRVMPTGTTERAVVTVALPWRSEPSGVEEV